MSARKPKREREKQAPRRRGRTAVVGVVAILALAAAAWGVWRLAAGPRALPAEPTANVLLITLDTTRADRIGVYGYADAQTPNLDRLAAEGTLFTHAVSSVPLTLPAHSSLMTGTYPPRHGVRDNGGYFLDDRWTTLAESLQGSGRATFAAVGAFVLHHLWGLKQGFDVYDDEFGKTSAKTHEMLQVQRDGAQVVEQGLSWLEQHKQGPFFAWLHFYDPHHPYEAPGEFGERFRERPYDGEIAYTDHLVGRVLDWLRAEGLYDSTLIVVVGDHGEGLDEHQEPDHGIFLYQSTLHIPLIVRTPHPAYRGVVESVVRDIDVLPTVLAYVGLRPPAEAQGASLLPLMAGLEERDPRLAYSETLYSRLHYGWAELAAVRDDRYKLIDAPRPELYDLRQDPGETRNLYASYRDVADRLRGGLAAVRAEASTADEPRMEQLDQETLDKLMSLGYVGSRAPVAEGPLPDPKDKLVEMNLLIMAGRQSAELLESGRFEEVASLLERVLQKEPNYMDGYLNLASAYRQLGRPQRAQDVLERALELTPENVNVMQSLGRTHMDLGDTDTAVALFQAIIARSPRYAQAYYGLSDAHVQRGEPAAAVRALESLLEVYPETPLALYEIGMVHLRSGRLEEARRWILRALEAAPRLRNAQFNLALIAEQRGDPAEARRRYEEELRQFPDNAEAAVNLGLLCAGSGDLDCAERSFAAAVQQAPDLAVAHYLLARTRAERGQVDGETLALARRAFEIDPSLERARRLASRIESVLAAGSR